MLKYTHTRLMILLAFMLVAFLIFKFKSEESDTTIILPIEIKSAVDGDVLYIEKVEYNSDSTKTIYVKFKE